MVPRVGVSGGGYWGGDDTAVWWSGSFGLRYYVSRSVGFSTRLYYEQRHSDSYRHDYNSFGVSWGLFMQFRASPAGGPRYWRDSEADGLQAPGTGVTRQPRSISF